MTNDTVICADCGASCEPRGIGPGYAVTWGDGLRVCYPCATDRQRAAMVNDGIVTAYVIESHSDSCRASQAGREWWQCDTPRDYHVTTWSGESLGTVTLVRHGRHNIAGRRLDVWFIGPDDKPWHGVNIGDNQVLRCKRIKSR